MQVWQSPCLAFALLSLGILEHATGGEPWSVEGRIVDEQGAPVSGFEVAYYWSSNGKLWDDSGKRLEPGNDIGEFWTNEGVMQAWPRCSAPVTGAGRFWFMSHPNRDHYCLYAMDLQHKRGGFAVLDGSDRKPKDPTIVLKPLVRVHGVITCKKAGKTPGWTCVRVHAPGDYENCFILTDCGSVKGRFETLLPAGRYHFDVYSENPDARMPKPGERKNAPKDMPPYLAGIEVVVPDDKTELDLGALDLSVMLE